MVSLRPRFVDLFASAAAGSLALALADSIHVAIIASHRGYAEAGGRFIVPIPEIRVL